MTGQRHSIKVLSCVDLYSARFLYRRDNVFNGITYLQFVKHVDRQYAGRPVIWIQDNASYHKDKIVWAWFSKNRDRWTVVNLPPYSPELNASERIWHHVRVTGTHNRYFITLEELDGTLTHVFRSIQRQPEQIRGYLQPFI